jgi:hypothetical protein
MYTKENKKSGIYDEIYFLNDNNIAFDKTSMSCDAGFNAVASQKEFVEVYQELSTVSSYFYTLSSKVETSIDTLSAGIDNVLSSDILAIKFCGHITLY